jgi:hypothetical protein
MKRSALRAAFMFTMLVALLCGSSSWADDAHHPAQAAPGETQAVPSSPAPAAQAQTQPQPGPTPGGMMNCPMMPGGQAGQGGIVNCPMMTPGQTQGMGPGMMQGMGPGMMQGMGPGQMQPGQTQRPPSGNQ